MSIKSYLEKIANLHRLDRSESNQTQLVSNGGAPPKMQRFKIFFNLGIVPIKSWSHILCLGLWAMVVQAFQLTFNSRPNLIIRAIM